MLSAEEFIPCSQKPVLVFLDNTRNLPDVSGPEARAMNEANRLKPELRFQAIFRHMYMGRLIAVARVEIEAIRA
jgi:hypothetical protein